MDTRGDSKRPLKGYARDTQRRRKVVLDLDLNTPPGESRAAALDESNNQQVGGGTTVPPPATIDLEAIDDEVVISSPRSFAEARNKSRRNQEVTVIDDGVSQARQEEAATRLTLNSYNMRKRPSVNQAVINCDHYINIEGKSNAKRKNVGKSPESSLPPPPPKPKEPTFSCPVCMGTLVEEMSTKCGHIFCKKCIKAAISAQNKCPTCRRKVSMKDTFRIYLPATTN